LMKETKNAPNRIKGLLPEGTVVMHKPGTSGADENGMNIAFNDLGMVTLPNGKHFVISVFITNSKESDEVNAAIIAEISKAAWDYFISRK
jgi:beta-lactamase class A